MTFTPAGTGAVARPVQSKLRDVVSVKDFGAVGDGTTDDTSAIQAALTATSDGAEMHFEPGKRYKVTSGLTRDKVAKIVGHGATLVTTTGITALTLRKTKGTYSAGAYFTPTANTNYFTIPASVTIGAGDFVLLASNTARITSYNHGIYAQVRRVAAGVAYLSTNFYAAFQVDRIVVYDPLFGSSIEGLNVDMSGATGLAIDVLPIGFTLVGVAQRLVGCYAKGSDYAAIGFSVTGEGSNIVDCQADGFLNTQGITGGRLGYGASLQGNNVAVRGGRYADCKHCLTSGDRQARSSGISYTGVRVTQDPTRAAETAAVGGAIYGGAVDFHGNVEAGDACSCYVEGPDTLLNVRCGSVSVVGNTFDRTARTVAGSVITFFEDVFANVLIQGNRFINRPGATDAAIGTRCEAATKTITNFSVRDNDCDTLALLSMTTTAGSVATTISGLRVTGNVSDGCFIRASVAIKDSIVSGNVMNCDTEGLLIDCSAGDVSNVIVTDNKIDYHLNATAGAFAYGIRIASTTATYPSLIANNRITRMNGAATTSPLRFTSAENAAIRGNVLNADWVLASFALLPVGNENTAGTLSWKNSTTVTPTGQLRKSAAPTGATWSVGDRVYNSAPAAGSPKSWVCTAAGTPGTWVSEGNL